MPESELRIRIRFGFRGRRLVTSARKLIIRCSRESIDCRVSQRLRCPNQFAVPARGATHILHRALVVTAPLVWPQPSLCGTTR
jgi:hypothetical protein